MGKMITLISMLVFIDLMFLITGQISGTINSTLFVAILDPNSIMTGAFFKDLIGNIGNIFDSTTGFASFLATITVATGFLLTTTDTKLFVPLAITLGLLAGDFVNIFVKLQEGNVILASLIMVPIILLYVLVTVEWLRGKD